MHTVTPPLHNVTSMLHVDDDGNEYLLHHHCYELQTALTRHHHHIIILLSYVDILNDQDKCRVRIVYFVLLCIPSPEKRTYLFGLTSYTLFCLK